MANDRFMGVRISADLRKKFNNKCNELDIRNPSEFVREMIEAFVDNRLKIQPTEKQKAIYHDN